MFKNYIPVKTLLEAARGMIKIQDKVSMVKLISAVAVADLEVKKAQKAAGTIETARSMYETDEVEFDDNPVIAEAEDGTWVSAWVLVPKESLKEMA